MSTNRKSTDPVSGMALTKRVYASGTVGAKNGPSSLLQPTAKRAPTSASPMRETLIRILASTGSPSEAHCYAARATSRAMKWEGAVLHLPHCHLQNRTDQPE